MPLASPVAAAIVLVVCELAALLWARGRRDRIGLSRLIVLGGFITAMLYVAATQVGPTLPQRVVAAVWLGAALVAIAIGLVPQLLQLRGRKDSSSGS
jgi:Kef-type K+ transport system membrane component KefB